MTFQFRPAERSNTVPLIGLYGLSGSGKTMSALLLARGLVGAQGKIGMIDTESGRGELYADVIPGGYQVLPLQEPFNPKRYRDAIDAAIQAKMQCLVIDSGSHEWEGIGGVLEEASTNQADGKQGLAAWREPKLEHQRFMLKLLQSPIPVVVCLRAKYKSRQVKDPQSGKNTVVKDDHATPMQAEDFIYEMTAHAEVLPDHTINLTKCSHPQLRECFPTDRPISVETGKAIAEWARGGSADPNIVDRAREVAAQGYGALRQWWREQTRPDQTVLRTHADELKRIATDADNGTSADTEATHGTHPDATDHAEEAIASGSGAASQDFAHPVTIYGADQMQFGAAYSVAEYRRGVTEAIREALNPRTVARQNADIAEQIDPGLSDEIAQLALEIAEQRADSGGSGAQPSMIK